MLLITAVGLIGTLRFRLEHHSEFLWIPQNVLAFENKQYSDARVISIVANVRLSSTFLLPLATLPLAVTCSTLLFSQCALG
jgi:hypothetical protein